MSKHPPRGPQPVSFGNRDRALCHPSGIATHPPVVRFLAMVRANPAYAREHGYDHVAAVLAWLMTPAPAHTLAAGGEVDVDAVMAAVGMRFVPRWSREDAAKALSGCVTLGVLKPHPFTWRGHWTRQATRQLPAPVHWMLRDRGVDRAGVDRAATIVALAELVRAGSPDPKPDMFAVIEALRSL